MALLSGLTGRLGDAPLLQSTAQLGFTEGGLARARSDNPTSELTWG